MKKLTKGDLFEIEKRIDQIDAALDLCGPNDDDVVSSLDSELELLIDMLEKTDPCADNVIEVDFKNRRKVGS